MISIATTISEVRRHVSGARREGRQVSLVPTMGALHDGHASLIDAARRESGLVIVSIFVNPLQFGPNEDFNRYPRTMDADLEICRKRGADLVFAPSAEEVYPSSDQLTFVEVTRVAEHLCGKFRPGHFRGVATVVSKLFNMVQPDKAFFGEKDFQQLAVIRRMTADLNLPIQIVGAPTVRESDGLALSSRNRYLDSHQRQIATSLYRALLHAQEIIRAGELNANTVRDIATELLRAEKGIRLEYFEIVDPIEVQPMRLVRFPGRIAGAMWVGNTRLIDNVPA